MIEYKGSNIQLLDLPGIIEGAAQGKGRGRQVIAVARTADLVLMILDATKKVSLSSKRKAIQEMRASSKYCLVISVLVVHLSSDTVAMTMIVLRKNGSPGG